MLFSGLICQNITQTKLFSMALVKVFTLCDCPYHVGLSTLVQLDSSLKKYVGLVHRWDN